MPPMKQVAFSTLKWKSFHLIVFLIQPRDSGQLHLPFPHCPLRPHLELLQLTRWSSKQINPMLRSEDFIQSVKKFEGSHNFLSAFFSSTVHSCLDLTIFVLQVGDSFFKLFHGLLLDLWYILAPAGNFKLIRNLFPYFSLLRGIISAYFVPQISSKIWVSFVAQTILLWRLPLVTFVDLDEVAPSWNDWESGLAGLDCNSGLAGLDCNNGLTGLDCNNGLTWS